MSNDLFSMSEKPKSGTRKSTPVTFRMDMEAHRALANRAKTLGLSIHQLAEIYVLESLCLVEERSALCEAVKNTNAMVAALRSNLSLSVEALLSAAGKASEEEARKWVTECFSPMEADSEDAPK